MGYILYNNSGRKWEVTRHWTENISGNKEDNRENCWSGIEKSWSLNTQSHEKIIKFKKRKYNRATLVKSKTAIEVAENMEAQFHALFTKEQGLFSFWPHGQIPKLLLSCFLFISQTLLHGKI